MTNRKNAQFVGTGLELFLIHLKNMICLVFTLGFYVPWARVNVLRFFINNVQMSHDRLQFLAQPAQLLKGYIRAVALAFSLWIAVVFGLSMVLISLEGVLPPYFLEIFIAINSILIMTGLTEALSLGKRRFRYGNTAFKGVRFAVDIKIKDYLKAVYPKIIFAIVTLGFKLPAYVHTRSAVLINNMRWGSMKLSYHGSQSEMGKLLFQALIFSILTLGVYMFWFHYKLTAYIVTHTKIGDIDAKLDIKVGGVFKLIIGNILIMILTLGLGYAWVKVRNHRFIITAFSIPDVNLNDVSAGAVQENMGVSEGLEDILDMDAGGVF